MKIFYSTINDCFYLEELKQSYQASGNWPPDCLEISYEDFSKFSLNNPPKNKVRTFIDNKLCWVDQKPSLEDLESNERSWRNFELRVADVELNKVQDGDPKSIGSVSDWRGYRKNLRAWPEHPNFPSEQYRPKSPKTP